MTQEKPLKGIRVLDMSRVLAAPYCSMILGDLGADVIKVERPGLGDETRAWGPPFAGNVCVNIRSKNGQKVIRELAMQSDVLLENYIPGKLAEYGLDYESLSAVNAGLVYCSVSGWGPNGPDAQRAGYDVIVEAEAGMMHVTGEQEGRPVKIGVALTDLTTGLYAHGAITAALLQRKTTGKGAKIDCSLLESQVASLVNIGSNYLIGGREATRWGTAHPSIVPYQAFHTSDSEIVVGATNNAQFVKLCKVLKHPELPEDPRFNTPPNRVKNRKVLLQLLDDVFRTQTTDFWARALRETGLPIGPVNNMEQTFNHPQVKASGIVQTVRHSTAGDVKLVSSPVLWNNERFSIESPPPTLGQHTDEVLGSLLGYSDSKIESLRKDGDVA